MKNNYQTPEIEMTLVSLEDGACIVTSNQETFTYEEGVWNI